MGCSIKHYESILCFYYCDTQLIFYVMVLISFVYIFVSAKQIHAKFLSIVIFVVADFNEAGAANRDIICLFPSSILSLN